MKTIQYKVVAVMIMGLLVGGIPAFAADDTADAVAYHQQKAAEYQEKIAAQDAIIAEHQQMPADYRKKFAIHPKVGAPTAVTKMETHCSAIVQDAQKLKANLQEFSQWHSMRAAELEGR